MRNCLLTLIIGLIYVFQSCSNHKKKEQSLFLNILNDELVAYSYGSKKDTLNILEYEIFNQSNSIYYINNIDDFFKSAVYKNGINLRIFDNQNKEVEYDKSLFPFGFRDSDFEGNFICNHKLATALNLEVERLKEENYFTFNTTSHLKHNFFIHPKEKISFRMYLNITDTLAYEEMRLNYAKIYSNQKYHCNIQLISDSSNYRKDLPKYILKRIKENNAEVFHGIIESSNTIPVKVIEY